MGPSAPRPPLTDLRTEGNPSPGRVVRGPRLPGAGPAPGPCKSRSLGPGRLLRPRPRLVTKHVGITLRAGRRAVTGTAPDFPGQVFAAALGSDALQRGACSCKGRARMVSARCAPNLMISRGRDAPRGPGVGCLPRLRAWPSAKQKPKLNTQLGVWVFSGSDSRKSRIHAACCCRSAQSRSARRHP